MTIQIDWSKPICLDTQPPMPARVVKRDEEISERLCVKVESDWQGDGREYGLWVNGEGVWRDAPRVRNLRPGEVIGGAADDVAAELAAALRAARDGLTFPAPSIGAVVRLIDAALAKWENRK